MNIQRAGLAIGAALAVIALMAQAATRGKPSSTDDGGEAWVELLGGARSGIVLIVAPANCTMDAETARMITATDSALGGRGVVIAVGMSTLAEAHRAIADLGIGLRMRLPSSRSEEAEITAGGQPTIAIVRNGRTELVARGQTLAVAARWLPIAIGITAGAGL
jgi:hypothetical protein